MKSKINEFKKRIQKGMSKRLYYILFALLLLGGKTQAQTGGALDTSFDIGTGFNGPVNSIALQSDGKILVGGAFTSYKGLTQNFIARLNTDGTLDTSFDIGEGFDSPVFSIVLQPDGKILVGGTFTSYNGSTRIFIARLNTDGTLDTSFNIGAGFNNYVQSIALQPDGKILVGGTFTTYKSLSQNRIVRLNTNGTLDNSFNIGTGFNNTVFSITLQSDGKILAGGNFTSYKGLTQNRIVRLNTDGTSDTSFDIGEGFNNNIVYSIALQSDGKILAGGNFTIYKGLTRNRIVQLEWDGTPAFFDIGAGFNSTVFSIALQPDGKILVGGNFITYKGSAQNRIARLNTDGSLDTSFDIGTGFNNYVQSIALQSDGKILAGGAFTSYKGLTQRYIARLYDINVYTISASSNPTEGGTVSGTGTYNDGTTATLSATANAGYTFVNWTEDDTEVSTNPEYSFTATANRTLVANFVAPPVVYIPDANFKNYLLSVSAINTNGDTEIQVSEAEAVTGVLNVAEKSIADLTGIEAFVNITQLSCHQNQLTSLDVSKNTALIYLFCFLNNLTTLDVSKNTALTTLWCYQNQLTSLDVTQNTALVELACPENQLTSLDVTKNTALTGLVCYQNQLTSLDVSKNTALTNLDCRQNQLTSLDVSKNTALTYLWCDNNQLTSLDVTQNTALTGLGCTQNQLTSLNVTKNTALTTLYCYENQLTSLDVKNTALTSLWCHDNKLTNLDVTQNTALTDLGCYQNQLTSLDVTQNTALTYLNCSYNQLTSLNLKNGNNTALYLEAYDNPNLTCIQVDDVANANANTYWLKDATASYSEDCTPAPVDAYSNANTDFSITNGNPNGKWTYGKGANDNDFSNFLLSPAYSGLINWQNTNSIVDGFPGVHKNISETPFVAGVGAVWLPGKLIMHPNNIGQTFTKLKYTPSVSGIYPITASWKNIDQQAKKTNARLVVHRTSGNTVLVDHTLNGYNAVHNYSGSVHINVGDYLTFEVGNGGDGYEDDSVEVEFIIDAPVVYIPDANFKNYLLSTSINTNGDTEIQVSEAEAVTGAIDVGNKNIADLTGIEAFVNLTRLDCYSNQLTALDVTKNTALTHLDCSNNQLTSLDVSKNTALTYLQCQQNQLTVLDVSKNTALTSLYCSQNQLTALDVTKNTALIDLYCYQNQLTNLDVSKNTALGILLCNQNQLTSLDVSKNTALTYLYCHNNQLTSLDVKNGQNNEIIGFEARFNPNLTCIQVDDASASHTGWFKDSTASYSEDCTPAPVVYIPDANFKAHLLSTSINTNGDAEIQVSEAEAFTGTINCSNKNIADLTGIEAFVNITKLFCDRNQLTSLDVTKNIALTELTCYQNQLTGLDVTKNTALTRLVCYQNQLTSLDVTKNTVLTVLTCYSNQLTALDVTKNTVLRELRFFNNQLASLDISKNTALLHLYCEQNQLTNLDVSKNTALINLWCNGNQLTSLDVTKNTDLTSLRCYQNQLTSLDVKNGQNNEIIGFDARQNPNLTCIQVDDASASYLADWLKDATASYSEDCTPICNAPTDLTATSITINSAVLGWTSPGSSFDIEYGTAGFTQGTGTQISDITSNSRTVASLSSNTQYQFYVRRDCGINESVWAGPFSFTTLKSAKTALNFDGTNDYLEKSNPVNLPVGSAARSMEVWVKTSGNVNYFRTIANYGITATSRRFGILIAADNGRPYFVGEGNDMQGTVSVTDGNWHHIAVTYTGGTNGTVSMYIDGVLNITSTKTLNTASGPLRIGRRVDGGGNTEYFNGTIDEVRIWNYVLTQSEIQARKDKELTSLENGLVSYFNFNKGVAGGNNGCVAVIDDMKGSNDVTVNNFAMAGATSNFVADGIEGEIVETIDCGTLAAADINKKEISVYPNPVKDVLHFSEEVSEVRIMDRSGRMIKQISAKGKSVNVSGLSTGSYIVKIKTANNNEAVFRIIKN